jgi:CHC2-type zinc finger protein
LSDIQKPDIEAVFEHYGLRIFGRDNGGWSKAECPMPDHEDRNPSASVNTSAGKWHCFTCSRGGDGYDIIQEREGFAGFSATREFAARFLDGSGEAVLDDGGSSGLLPSRPRRNKGYRNKPAPWLRL